MGGKKLSIRIEPYSVFLKKPFRISRDVYDHKKGIRVFLSFDGHTGVGEANEHRYYKVTPGSLLKQGEELAQALETKLNGIHQLPHPAEFYSLMHQTIGFKPFTLAAFDLASWDLYGKTHHPPARQLFGLVDPPDSDIKTSYTISIDEPARIDGLQFQRPATRRVHTDG